MGWTQVPDKSAGDIFTEAMWDTYIRDNLNSGVPVMLANTTLGSAAASITFSAIDQTFAHLMVVAYLRGDKAAVFVNARLRFNGDSGSNYDQQLMQGSAASASATEAFAQSSAQVGYAPANTAGANLFSALTVTVPYYAQATNNKSASSESAFKSGTATTNLNVASFATFWRSNSAITSLTLLPESGNFAAGSRATLYAMP